MNIYPYLTIMKYYRKNTKQNSRPAYLMRARFSCISWGGKHVFFCENGWRSSRAEVRNPKLTGILDRQESYTKDASQLAWFYQTLVQWNWAEVRRRAQPGYFTMTGATECCVFDSFLFKPAFIIYYHHHNLHHDDSRERFWAVIHRSEAKRGTTRTGQRRTKPSGMTVKEKKKNQMTTVIQIKRDCKQRK